MNGSKNCLFLFRWRYFKRLAVICLSPIFFAGKISNRPRSGDERSSVIDSGDAVLFLTLLGGHLSHLWFDIVVALRLRRLGYQVEFVICEGAQGCALMESTFLSPKDLTEGTLYRKALCLSCSGSAKLTLSLFRLRYRSIAPSLINKADNDKVRRSVRDAAVRFSGGDQEVADKIFTQFYASSIGYEAELRGILSEVKPLVVWMNHGVYVPQGDALQVLKDLNIPFYCYFFSNIRGTILVTRNDTYHAELPRLRLSDIDHSGWPDDWESRVYSYLRIRQQGMNELIFYQANNKRSVSREIFTEIREFNSVCAIFPNVAWDASSHFTSELFDGMEDWLKFHLSIASDFPNTLFVIRAHPGENLGAIKAAESSRIKVEASANVKVIEGGQDINSYGLLESVDFVSVWGSKIGLEAACMGIPTMMAASGWIKNKGIAFEPESKEQFCDFLSRPDSLAPENFKGNAMKFAYYLFFVRMIPVSVLSGRKIPGMAYSPCENEVNKALDGFDPGIEAIVELIGNVHVDRS